MSERVLEESLLPSSILRKGHPVTVTLFHTNDSKSTVRNVTRVDCDGITVAIHYYGKDRDIESLYFDLGYDTKHSECMIYKYEVSIG